MGLNVSQDFMRLASVFLNCRVGSIPFKYLGLPVGANVRREATWEPLINSLRKRLGGWTNRFVSFGGRITLLNSVLNAIPIFYLSYLKIPIKVWKKIRRIQRDFLWGARGDRKKVNWIKWDVVCQPKRLGGLGVRDIRAVNISLMAKWRWRLLTDDHVLWKEVLRGKYGDSAIGRVVLGEECIPWFASTWWKDICSIGVNLDHNWFSQQVIKKMGNGEQTSFWKDLWIGTVPLCEKFPRLYSISLQKEVSVATLRDSNEAGWTFVWRRRLFVWETTLLEELTSMLNSVILSTVADGWGWKLEKEEGFSVKSSYDYVSRLLVDRNQVLREQETAFDVIWKCKVPSKVAGFVWMVLHDRAPTRENLARRNIIEVNGNHGCVFCGGIVESASHLFLYCKVVLQVWEKVFAWLDLNFMLPHNILSLLNYVASFPGSKRVRQGLVTIWCAVLWTVWRHRNRIIFDNGVVDAAAILEDIKIASWKWWLRKGEAHLSLFYEWSKEPVLCLKR
jgi:hypothetical protein